MTRGRPPPSGGRLAPETGCSSNPTALVGRRRRDQDPGWWGPASPCKGEVAGGRDPLRPPNGPRRTTPRQTPRRPSAPPPRLRPPPRPLPLHGREVEEERVARVQRGGFKGWCLSRPLPRGEFLWHRLISRSALCITIRCILSHQCNHQSSSPKSFPTLDQLIFIPPHR